MRSSRRTRRPQRGDDARPRGADFSLVTPFLASLTAGRGGARPPPPLNPAPAVDPFARPPPQGGLHSTSFVVLLESQEVWETEHVRLESAEEVGLEEVRRLHFLLHPLRLSGN